MKECLNVLIRRSNTCSKWLLYTYILLHRLMYAIESRDRRTLLSAFKYPKRTTSKLQNPIGLCPQSLLHVEDHFLDHLAKTLHESKGVWNPDRKEEKIEHCKNQGLASEREKNNSLSFGYDSMMKPQSSSEPRKRTLCLIRYRGIDRPTIPRFEHNSTRLLKDPMDQDQRAPHPRPACLAPVPLS